MKLLKYLLVIAALGFGTGCQIDKAHFAYDQQAFKLVEPLAEKELNDKLAAGEITQEEFNDRIAALKEWQRVVEDNVK